MPMKLSPEEYGAYWSASMRVAAGVVLIVFVYRFVDPFLGQDNVGAVGIGLFLLAGTILLGSFLAMLGVARVVRTAVEVEMGR